VKWNNGSNSWVVLKDLKDAYLVQIAEYAVQLQTRKSFGHNHQLGPEYKGRRAIIGKALYSLQSSRR
jgi:hypothetical protein